jgi:hypothetical protein
VTTEQAGSNRVIRGGSWNNNAGNLRSAKRNNNAPDNRNNKLGLRFVSTRQQPGEDRPRISFACTGHVQVVILRQPSSVGQISHGGLEASSFIERGKPPVFETDMIWGK